MLNVPTQSFPAPSSQQRVSAGGSAATGRNKVALKPGHSLMDWIRFAKSGKDLTGLRGRLIEVTPDELKKHNTRDDCWTCIRGFVYNVTPYMDYHPGGEGELMRAAGIDGTDLFDQVHRWVNYESMLKECLVGKMSTKPVIALNAVFAPPPAALGPPPSVAPPPDKDGRPRYDWFQTDSTVHLVIYAKRKLPASGCAAVDLRDGVLRIEVLLQKMSYVVHLRLAEEVEENVSVKTAFSVGKIQVACRKRTAGKWESLGRALESHNTFLCKQDRAVFYRECSLVSRTDVNHNTQLYRLRLPPGSAVQVPVGKHVYLKDNIQDAEVVRPYTPVDRTLWTPQDSDPDPDLYLMVKVYPDGLFTPHLHRMNPGDSIGVSGPEGSFSLRPLRDITHLFLVAAGTGLTPMARLVHTALSDVESVKETKLLFFNRKEEDILWRSELDELAAIDERFQVEYVLSEPCESWSGARGRVNESLLRGSVSKPDGSKRFACVCGPSAFTELTIGLLKQLGFEEQELHAFQG
ncbi:cytochrome b5 reductase 4 [Eucyclogobius newberryi]|uniref:cytochrome b5 reductase 4 n=1 Tax=Eucyclogobius newberryi TaxID=166745 RepID=UPI003B58C9BF